jgi:hypothetical protein
MLLWNKNLIVFNRWVDEGYGLSLYPFYFGGGGL